MRENINQDKLIIHCHIFKNAGSSIDKILKSQFHNKFYEFTGSEDLNLRKDQTHFLNNVILQKKYEAVSGHFMPFLPTKYQDIDWLIMFRDPIERALSIYEFEKIQNIDTPGANNAKKLEIEDYFKWRLSSESPPVIRNSQSLRLTNKKSINEINKQDCLKIINNKNVIWGLVKNSSNFFRIKLNNLLNSYNKKSHEVIENKNKNKKHHSLKDVLSLNTYNRLIDLNRMDILLIEHLNKIKDI